MADVETRLPSVNKILFPFTSCLNMPLSYEEQIAEYRNKQHQKWLCTPTGYSVPPELRGDFDLIFFGGRHPVVLATMLAASCMEEVD